MHDAAEWKGRHRDNLSWTRDAMTRHGQQVHAMVILAHANPQANHEDFFKPFVEAAKTFSASRSSTSMETVIAGSRTIPGKPRTSSGYRLTREGKAPPLKVTVRDDPQEPFQFDRRK